MEIGFEGIVTEFVHGWNGRFPVIEFFDVHDSDDPIVFADFKDVVITTFYDGRYGRE